MKKKVAKKLAEQDFTDLNPYQVNLPKIIDKKSRLADPLEPYNISRHKKVEIIYELERNDMKDPIPELINNLDYSGIKIITTHFGYTQDPLGKNKETPE